MILILWFYSKVLRSEIASGICAKLRTVAASNNRVHIAMITLLLLVRATYMYGVVPSCTSCSWWLTQSTQHHWRGCNNIPSFLQRTAPIARSLCVDWTRHDLYILVTAPFRCDRTSRAAYAQSFALWQQATIEFTLPWSLCYCLFAPLICMVLFLHIHPVRGVSHNQRNTTGKVATKEKIQYTFLMYCISHLMFFSGGHFHFFDDWMNCCLYKI